MSKEKKPGTRVSQDTWKFPVKLPSGMSVKITVKQTEETIDRKVKVQTGVKVMGKDWVIPVLTNVRDKKGMPVTAPVTVRGLRVTVEFSDGAKLTSRSCCKPPDVYRPGIGKRKAMHRLFQLDSGIDVRTNQKSPEFKGKTRLNGEDRKALYYAVLTNGEDRKPNIKKVEKPTTTTPESKVAVG